jgi:lysophospholipase L1-like esterase
MKTMAILGDSYSTYKGWIPENYLYWYADEGNECENDMKSVMQTWWWSLARARGILLLANCSYSGSTVCNTGYDAQDASETSFIHRMKRELGEGRTVAEQPDILIVFGGTNDFWAGSPVGKIKYGDWTDEDFRSFAPAFCYMMEYVKRENPKACIYNVVNDEITGEIRDIMAEVCRHYSITNIELHGIEKQNGHPNAQGMAAIREQIEQQIFE